jgi:periplasmic protein CpxP/Spy
MRNAINTLTLTAALVAAVAANSMAASREPFDGPPPGPPHGGHFIRTLESLGLTAAQKQEVKAILKDNAPTVKPLVEKFAAERRQLRTLVQAEHIDETAIRAQSVKIASLEADMAINRARIGQQVRAILTPEQRLKAEELFQKADARMDRSMRGAFEKIEAE